MHFFRQLTVISCLLVSSANVFAAVAAEDVWSQELSSYEAVFRDAQQYFSEPVDEARVPSNAIFLGAQDGYRRYKLPETEAYLFGVMTPEQRKELMGKIDFLFRLICSCGQQYSIRPIDVQLPGVLKKEITSTKEGFYHILGILSEIANKLKNQDYLDELDLNRLFTFIDWAIHELNKSKGSKELIESMYVPIKSWIIDNFRVSPMLQHIVISSSELPIRTDGGYAVFTNYAFKYGSYFNEYHSKTRGYQKITEWLDGPKLRTVKEEQKIIADQELKEFERVITVPFDRNQAPSEWQGNDDVFCAFIRYVESIHNQGEALLEKWCNFIDEEKEESERLAQEKATARAAKIPPKKIDPKAALAEMMRSLGIEDDSQPSKASSKAKKTTKPNSIPKESKAEMERLHQAAERARTLREVEETERLAQLEEIKRENAERNAALELRQAELRERREQERQNRKMIMKGLLQREAEWVESLYAETQKLPVYNSSELIDPAIFLGQSDYKRVIDALRAAGIYIKEHIHGNEKCFAMWKDSDGKNKMVWFDAPHGVQVSKGAAAGWVISLQKALKESGRLLSR